MGAAAGDGATRWLALGERDPSEGCEAAAREPEPVADARDTDREADADADDDDDADAERVRKRDAEDDAEAPTAVQRKIRDARRGVHRPGGGRRARLGDGFDARRRRGLKLGGAPPPSPWSRSACVA